MVSPSRIAKPNGDGLITFYFNPGSSTNILYSFTEAGNCYDICAVNCTFTITSNSQTICSTSNPNSFSVGQRQTINISITPINAANKSQIQFFFNQPSSQTITFSNYTPTGNQTRYLYTLSGSTITVVDTSLLTTSNLKTITAITNGGTTLTLTCASHGLSNGNVISLVDVGGFSPDVNYKPFTVSGVTTNTFTITTTVTGTWNSAGWLAAAWITNPIVTTINLPVSGSPVWNCLCYCPKDLCYYIFGTASSSYLAVCKISADTSSPNYNIVYNWDNSVSNSYSSISITATNPNGAVYDPVFDSFLLSSTILYQLKRYLPLPSLISKIADMNNVLPIGIYCYNSSTAVASDRFIQTYRCINGDLYGGSTQLAGWGGYSTATSAIWAKPTNNVIKYTGDFVMNTLSTVSGADPFQGFGCAVDSLNKFYFTRYGSPTSFSFGSTLDYQIWDTSLNTVASAENGYIVTPGSGAGVLGKPVYSWNSNNVMMADNSTSGRIHLLCTTKASGKKYIGYISIGATIKDIALNHYYGI